jgi:hypothetical protein
MIVSEERNGTVGERNQAPRDDWFNPSIAHHVRCSSRAISQTRTGRHGPNMGQPITALATYLRGS